MNKKIIISFLQKKGGSGKTTSAVSLAGAIQRVLGNSRSVCLIDCDTEKADAYRWISQSPEFEGKAFQYDYSESENQYFKTFNSFVDDLKSGHEVLIFDTPPDGSENCIVFTHWLSKLSDLVVIPFTPSSMDASSIHKVVDSCEMENAKYRILKTRWNNTVMSDVLSESMGENYPVLQNAIPQSVSFVEAEAAGLSVYEYDKRSKNNNVLDDVAKEILKEAGCEC